MGIFNFFTQDLAIDLGTANTLIMHKDKLVVDDAVKKILKVRFVVCEKF